MFFQKPHFASWDEFWDAYDVLCKQCDPPLAAELNEAQGYVNGLTDGWHDFSDALQRIESHYRYALDEEATERLSKLRQDLARVLKNR